jgi:hypothetical protein
MVFLRSRIRRWLSEGITDRSPLAGDKLGGEESLSDGLVGWVRRWGQRWQFAGVVTQLDIERKISFLCVAASLLA